MLKAIYPSGKAFLQNKHNNQSSIFPTLNSSQKRVGHILPTTDKIILKLKSWRQAIDEERNEEGKLHLEGSSNLNPTLDLPESSPAGTDQVLWRDNEKVGERRDNHQAKPPTVLTNAEACRTDFENLIKPTMRNIWKRP
jgi:hypothetical protein